jgi:hypothetical protein
MKLFKQLEFYSSVLLIMAFFTSWLITRDGELLFTAYYVVGALHVTGMITHALAHWFTNAYSPRLYYHWLVVILLLLVPLGIGLWILLYAAPFMAIAYTWICWRELRALQLKAFVHLK